MYAETIAAEAWHVLSDSDYTITAANSHVIPPSDSQIDERNNNAAPQRRDRTTSLYIAHSGGFEKIFPWLTDKELF